MSEVLEQGGQDEQGEGDGRPRRSRRLPLVVAALLVLLLGLTAADRGQERREYDRLVACARAGQAAVAYSDRRVTAMVQYSSPLLVSSSAPLHVRVGLGRLVQDEAAGQVASVRSARDAAASVPVLPWHAALRAARGSYLEALDARVAYLEALDGDLGELWSRHPELDEGLGAARDAFAAAAPTPEQGRRADPVFSDVPAVSERGLDQGAAGRCSLSRRAG